MSFSLDSSTIATASSDNTVRLWTRSGELITTLRGHQRGVSSVSFSPDGQFIATGSYDGTAKIWRVFDLDGLIAQGCEWARDYLTYNTEVTNEQRAMCGIPPRE